MFVLLKLREAYLNIAQVKEFNEVNEVSDLCNLGSRRLKLLMGARKNGGARETHKGRRSSLPRSVSPLRMFLSCTLFFLTYYFQVPSKQTRIHCVRIKLYSWFSLSEMDVTFFITAKLIPWLCDRCKPCSMTLNMLQLSH